MHVNCVDGKEAGCSNCCLPSLLQQEEGIKDFMSWSGSGLSVTCPDDESTEKDVWSPMSGLMLKKTEELSVVVAV